MSNNASNALGNSQEMRPKVEDTRYGKNVEFSHLTCIFFRNSSKIRHVSGKNPLFIGFPFSEGAGSRRMQKGAKKMQKGCKKDAEIILIW